MQESGCLLDGLTTKFLKNHRALRICRIVCVGLRFPIAWCQNIKSLDRYATLSGWKSKAQIRNLWYCLLDQKRRRNRIGKRKSKLHQVKRSSQSDKTFVFKSSFRIHHTWRMLGEFYFHSCNSLLAKNHANAVLSAAWQSSPFVWCDSCTLWIPWQLDRWEIKEKFPK